MKNIPEKIYVQIGEHCEADDFNECDEESMTFAPDKIFPNDIEYSLSPSQTPDWTKEKTYDSEGTVDKEAIWKKNKEDKAIPTWSEAAYKSMDEYAASLIKERDELKERFEKSFNLAEIRRKEIDKLILEQGQLQSSNEAKEKECEYWKQLAGIAGDVISHQESDLYIDESTNPYYKKYLKLKNQEK